MKLWLKIILGVFLLLVLLGGGYVVTHSGYGVDRNNLPKFIQADFIDLSKIYSISKFRSGEGHDFSGGGEKCRSMKHYYTPQYDATVDASVQKNNGIPPKPDGKTDIPIYSPVDGTITQLAEEHTPIGRQVYIIPSAAKQFTIRIFHVFTLPNITTRMKVTAGQQIGVIGKYQGTDISVQIGGMPWNENYVSYFEVMPDNIFASYLARGATTRDDFIFTKEYRDAHPLQCATDKSETFIYPANYDRSQDDVHLSGYTAPDYGQSGPGSNQQNSASPAQNYGNNVPTQQSAQTNQDSTSQSSGSSSPQTY